MMPVIGTPASNRLERNATAATGEKPLVQGMARRFTLPAA
jgi:hypothetical protein